MNALKDMVLGRPASLVSTFRWSYYTILNLMSRAEGQFTAEHVIRNSFHQFQYEKVSSELKFFYATFYATSLCITTEWISDFAPSLGFTRHGEKDFNAWRGSCHAWCLWRGKIFFIVFFDYYFDWKAFSTCYFINVGQGCWVS